MLSPLPPPATGEGESPPSLHLSFPSPFFIKGPGVAAANQRAASILAVNSPQRSRLLPTQPWKVCRSGRSRQCHESVTYKKVTTTKKATPFPPIFPTKQSKKVLHIYIFFIITPAKPPPSLIFQTPWHRAERVSKFKKSAFYPFEEILFQSRPRSANVWELRGEGDFWSFMSGSRVGEVFQTPLPLLPRRQEEGRPSDPRAPMEPPVPVLLALPRSEPCWGEFDVLWRPGNPKDEETSRFRLGPLFLLIVGASHSGAGFWGLRGAPALLEQKRTKGRRPCWHHDAASLPPAAERCLCSRPRSLLPPKHEFYF
ncbi:uncharacterized protein LOC126065661 [Elephas maximus indicus]|uniref:uncharacterized protein LOC126065661 n=1 Tax=Elephas maximus indicus TaxID=99487 RepID=UPI0021168688|nr:uncharacterized protein LOC126065661 [Elephas maximus indicus]